MVFIYDTIIPFDGISLLWSRTCSVGQVSGEEVTQYACESAIRERVSLEAEVLSNTQAKVRSLFTNLLHYLIFQSFKVVAKKFGFVRILLLREKTINLKIAHFTLLCNHFLITSGARRVKNTMILRSE
jgi:hypothetical protein